MAPKAQAVRVNRRAQRIQVGPTAESGAGPREPEVAGGQKAQSGPDLGAGDPVVEVVAVVEADNQRGAAAGADRRRSSCSPCVDLKEVEGAVGKGLGSEELDQVRPSPRGGVRLGRLPRGEAGTASGRKGTSEHLGRGAQPKDPDGQPGAALRVTQTARTRGKRSRARGRPAGHCRFKMRLPTGRGNTPDGRREGDRLTGAKEPHVALVDEQPNDLLGTRSRGSALDGLTRNAAPLVQADHAQGDLCGGGGGKSREATVVLVVPEEDGVMKEDPQVDFGLGLLGGLRAEGVRTRDSLVVHVSLKGRRSDADLVQRGDRPALMKEEPGGDMQEQALARLGVGLGRVDRQKPRHEVGASGRQSRERPNPPEPRRTYQSRGQRPR